MGLTNEDVLPLVSPRLLCVGICGTGDLGLRGLNPNKNVALFPR